MVYISYENLISDIKANLYKIPKDIVGVIGIPRSGMLPATMISEHLNVGLSTINEFCEKGMDAFKLGHGNRKIKETQSNKILVFDDTCYNGNEIHKNKIKLSKFNNEYEFIFACVYLEGDCPIDRPDLHLVDIREKVKASSLSVAIYEWNIFANPAIMNKTMFDLDGVLCEDPPDERNLDEYIKYIKNPTTIMVPTLDKITICTYRLIKYKDETLQYLTDIGLTNREVYMVNTDSYEERGKCPPEVFKALVYNKFPDFELFVESNDEQARNIFRITNRPVYCSTTNKMYAQ